MAAARLIKLTGFALPETNGNVKNTDPWLIKYYPRTSLVIVSGQEIHLPNLQNRILHFGLTQPQGMATKFELIQSVWGFDWDKSLDITLKVHTFRLRRLIKDNKNNPHIETIVKSGYQFRGFVITDDDTTFSPI